jgi:hypothetical protein
MNALALHHLNCVCPIDDHHLLGEADFQFD